MKLLKMCAGTAVVAFGSVFWTAAYAQEPRMSDYFWLTRDTVQRELRMTETQLERLKGVIQKAREARRSFERAPREKRAALGMAAQEGHRRELETILQPEQRRRLGQIALQMRGADAFTDGIGPRLGLTEAQSVRLRSLSQEQLRRASELRQDLGNPNEINGARRSAIALRVEYLGKALEVLSPEQKERWRELSGEPVRF